MNSEANLAVTRQSLVARLANWEDQRNWQEFFETYWRLIYAVARKAGLTDSEAQDVVQETVLTTAKNVHKYDPAGGSFRGWLLNITRWRVADQFRKRMPEAALSRTEMEREEEGGTRAVENLAATGGIELDRLWESEWLDHLLTAAMTRLKRRVAPRHIQVFECVFLKQWSAAKVAKELGVNIAQVYLIKHRVLGQLRQEIRAIHGSDADPAKLRTKKFDESDS
jgi:RNA polymerase sigma-70 factor (ECF subfamily)